jgi:thiosulfate reductase cytochrome b subunit
MEANAVPARVAVRVATERVVRKHHALVRVTHWLHLPLLLLLAASGLSIYWAAPVFRQHPGPGVQYRDYLRSAGVWIAGALHDSGGRPQDWVYDHFSLGTGQLAMALRLHWLLAYAFMLNGALYAIGLVAGGGWRALLPRGSDPAGAIAMLRYYAGVIPMALRRKPWPHPHVQSKYNALQRGAYFAMPLVGALMVLTGWAMHKPSQLGWLERAFGSYDVARVLHFAGTLVLVTFIVPHVILVAADGWDTFRSMVVGWSARVKENRHD